MLRLLVILTLVAAVPAAVKREEYSPGNGNTGSAPAANSQPVYSPSSPSSSYSGGSSAPYNSNTYPARESYSSSANAANNQYPTDHSASASSASASYQSQPSSQGNLYYYYYPVQDKPKEPGYHASSSNQYASAVNPNYASAVANSQSAETGQHSGLDSAASGQDLSYSAQDLSYSAQNLGQGIANEYSSQNGASYDQQLSNLASQLQQYGFGSNPSGYSSSGQGSYSANNFDSSASNFGSSASSPSASFSSQGEALHSASSHPSYSAAAAASSFGGQNGGQLPYNGQTNGYTYGSGQPSYGNFASASGPQASYEQPSTGLRKYGLSSILMPMLALAGLSLLIPTVTSLGSSGRRRRAIDDNPKDSAMNGYIDRLERYYSIYRTAVEKEECMNRIICELG